MELKVTGKSPLLFTSTLEGGTTTIDINRREESGASKGKSEPSTCRFLQCVAASNRWFPLRPVWIRTERRKSATNEDTGPVAGFSSSLPEHMTRSLYNVEVLPPGTFDVDLGGAGGHTAGAVQASGLGLLVLPGKYPPRTTPWTDGENEQMYLDRIPLVLEACKEAIASGKFTCQEPHKSVEQLVGTLFEFLLSEEEVNSYSLDDVDDIAESPDTTAAWLVWAWQVTRHC